MFRLDRITFSASRGSLGQAASAVVEQSVAPTENHTCPPYREPIRLAHSSMPFLEPGELAWPNRWAHYRSPSAVLSRFTRSSKHYPTTGYLYQRLASKQAGLIETPVYFAKDRGTVRLRPLQAHAVTTATDRTQADLPTITLKMMLRNSISDSLVDDVALWLKQNAPSDITLVSITELTDQTRELRDFIAEENESRSANTLINMDQLPTESQDQVRDAWFRFTGRLVHSLRHFGLQDYKDMN
ncbi:hypothetical protein AUP68_08612 [Ilyonectria robusta]